MPALSPTFASTAGQTTTDKIAKMRAVRFTLNARLVVSETASGGLALEQRDGFMRLLERLEDTGSLRYSASAATGETGLLHVSDDLSAPKRYQLCHQSDEGM